MAAKQFYVPFRGGFNSNGLLVPNAVAKLFVNNTTTPANFYSDSSLTTSIGSSITANGAGRFQNAYADDGTPFRIRIEDASGNLLDEFDDYYFGTITGTQGPPGTVTANSGVSTSRGTLSGGGTETTVFHDVAVPTGSQTNSRGYSDAVTGRLIIATNRFTNGSASHTNYYDTVINFGLNMNTAYTPANNKLASGRVAIESKYTQTGGTTPFAMEFHLMSLFAASFLEDGVTAAAGAGEEFRGISGYIPHVKADWTDGSQITHRSAKHDWHSGDGVQRLIFDLRSSVKQIQLIDNMALNFNENNVPIIYQRNVADTAVLTMPYIDLNEALYQQQPNTVIGAFRPSQIFGNSATILAADSGQFSGATADDYLIYRLSTTAVTGSLNLCYLDGNASVATVITNKNSHASGAAVFNAEGVGAATGYQVNGTKVVGAQGAAVADASGGATVDAEARTALNALLARLRTHGLIAT